VNIHFSYPYDKTSISRSSDAVVAFHVVLEQLILVGDPAFGLSLKPAQLLPYVAMYLKIGLFEA
jgi:hypothetical protein